MQGIRKGERLRAEDLIPQKEGHTISKGLAEGFVLFSLAPETDISAETYMEEKSFWLLEGEADIAGQKVKAGEIVQIPRDTLLGLESKDGARLLEGTWPEEGILKLPLNQPKELGSLIDFVEGGIANKDLAKRKGMKFGLLAFDKGQGLTPHSAPGDALIVGLEGRAKIGMGDVEAELGAGDFFVFIKNIPHSVLALEPFKMAILMVAES